MSAPPPPEEQERLGLEITRMVVGVVLVAILCGLVLKGLYDRLDLVISLLGGPAREVTGRR